MADKQENDGGAGVGLTYTTALIGAVLATIVVAIVGFVTEGSDLGIPVLVLGGICVAAAVTYRLVGTTGPQGESDPGGSSLPELPADAGRPLGDTEQVHDELNPHDIPKDSPERQAAVDMAHGEEGTTRGKEEGGAAGSGGSESDDQDAVGPGEAAGGAQTTGRD